MRTVALRQVTRPVALDKLPFEPLLELQRGLCKLGYPVRGIDGQYGQRTRNAWAEFQISCGQASDGVVQPGTVGRLCDQVAELEDLGAADLTTRDGTIQAISAGCERHGLRLREQKAYVLATVEHETNRTFMPVREAYYLGGRKAENYRQGLRYYPYYGRGYVQLTWDTNYAIYGTMLELPLLTQPDLAMEPAVALFVLLHGFRTGAFTGRRLDEFVNAQRHDYVEARRCINGSDRADDIAALTRDFLRHV